jgi:hypothetical protein
MCWCCHYDQEVIISLLSSRSLVPGRVLLVSLTLDQRTSSFCNAHNHGFSSSDLSSISGALHPLAEVASADPPFASLLLLGDLNSIEDKRIAFSLAAAAPTHERAWHGHRPVFWGNLFRSAVEIGYSVFSYLSLASNKLNSLTRVFGSLNHGFALLCLFLPLSPMTL